MAYIIKQTVEYSEWLSEQQFGVRVAVDARIDQAISGNFGLINGPFGRIWEFKWKSGLRIYYGVVRSNDRRTLILVFGGNKNGQEKDIRKAQKIFERFSEDDQTSSFKKRK